DRCDAEHDPGDFARFVCPPRKNEKLHRLEPGWVGDRGYSAEYKCTVRFTAGFRRESIGVGGEGQRTANDRRFDAGSADGRSPESPRRSRPFFLGFFASLRPEPSANALL